eukprot:TRINITY_DN66337_c8_g8_i1.p1 TRINITY_DN66337_c8_g8~~TRINITY_DN66337_c8_g8_i1.p1  ORF type:complete len:412 (+),score=51.13 TRINITY_DN66337_c8_g8_i1:77-1312(+)
MIRVGLRAFIGGAGSHSSSRIPPQLSLWRPGRSIRWATTINLPALGDSIREAKITSLHVKPGSYIEEDEFICEVETDKLSQEIPCNVSGYVEKVYVEEAETMEVGQPLIDVEEGPRKPGDEPAPEPEPEPAKAKEEPASTPTSSQPATPPPTQATPPAEPKKAAPQQEQKAALTNVDGRGIRRVEMSPMRKAIQANMMNAQWHTAMLTTFQEINMSNLIQLRKDYKDAFERKHGVKLGFMSAFVKASATALMEIPAVNGSIDGNDMILHDYADIGVAVATPKGLVVPVLRNCQDMSYADIEKGIGAYAEKARTGKITLSDMQGGTFTISNGGVFGSLAGTPILNYPQSAILGMHKISQRAIVDEKGNIVAAPIMFVALTYDHRIIDGREAVTFLVRIKNLVEDPQRLLLDM